MVNFCTYHLKLILSKVKETYKMSLQLTSRLQLGIIGENIPPSEFTNIINLNTLHHNFPIFDHLGKKDDMIYVFSTKARKRFGANNKLNSSYNILYNSDSISRKFEKAQALLKENGYDITKVKYCFLIAPIEEEKDCKFYWGEFTDIDPNCTPENIKAGKIKRLGVNVSDTYLSSYKVFGTHSWETIKSQLTCETIIK